MRQLTLGLALVAATLVIPSSATGQANDATTRFVEVATGYRLVPNVVYLRAGGHELLLDVYQSFLAMNEAQAGVAAPVEPVTDGD